MRKKIIRFEEDTFDIDSFIDDQAVCSETLNMSEDSEYIWLVYQIRSNWAAQLSHDNNEISVGPISSSKD